MSTKYIKYNNKPLARLILYFIEKTSEKFFQRARARGILLRRIYVSEKHSEFSKGEFMRGGIPDQTGSKPSLKFS
jgi:hypothetical protein|tara:strand:- start:424 stop:648 length:225 start_codon:yes stop_codon:yes gene_type:complete